MTDRQRAAAAHEKVLSALFDGDKNPTYALSAPCLENITSRADVFLMEDYGFIKYVGCYNGNSTYQVRF